MLTPTETAIIVAVPEAESVVGRHRARFDAAASWGVPAHVTILYPFLDPEAVTDEVVQRLRDAVARTKPFTCTFTETRWFGDDVLWLAPHPDAPFRALTTAVARVDEVRAVETRVQAELPVQTRVTQALLMAGTAAPHAWRVAARLPLSP